jgi:hypothetical protein
MKTLGTKLVEEKCMYKKGVQENDVSNPITVTTDRITPTEVSHFSLRFSSLLTLYFERGKYILIMAARLRHLYNDDHASPVGAA